MDNQNRDGPYWLECARLLYWTFFKPFTFRQWLKEIHPGLDILTNPFEYREAFADNPRLERYAGQVAWINLLTPFLITIPAALLYTWFSGEIFVWSKSALFLAGWSLGLLLATSLSRKLQEWLLLAVLAVVVINLLWQMGLIPKALNLLPHGPVWIEAISAFFQNAKVMIPLVRGGVIFSSGLLI